MRKIRPRLVYYFGKGDDLRIVEPTGKNGDRSRH